MSLFENVFALAWSMPRQRKAWVGPARSHGKWTRASLIKQCVTHQAAAAKQSGVSVSMLLRAHRKTRTLTPREAIENQLGGTSSRNGSLSYYAMFGRCYVVLGTGSRFSGWQCRAPRRRQLLQPPLVHCHENGPKALPQGGKRVFDLGWYLGIYQPVHDAVPFHIP